MNFSRSQQNNKDLLSPKSKQKTYEFASQSKSRESLPKRQYIPIQRSSKDYRSKRKQGMEKDSRSISTQSYLLESFESDSDVYIAPPSSKKSNSSNESDSEQIQDIRQTAKESRLYLSRFLQSNLEKQRGYNLREKKKQGTFLQNSQVYFQKNRLKIMVNASLCVLMVILLAIALNYGQKTHKFQAISKLGAGISSCWDNFKKQSCDLNNPVGPFCKKLLQCTLNQQKSNLNQKSQQSIVQQCCILGIITILVYLFGLEKTSKLFIWLYQMCKNIFQQSYQKNSDEQQKANIKE